MTTLLLQTEPVINSCHIKVRISERSPQSAQILQESGTRFLNLGIREFRSAKRGCGNREVNLKMTVQRREDDEVKSVEMVIPSAKGGRRIAGVSLSGLLFHNNFKKYEEILITFSGNPNNRATKQSIKF